MKTTFLIFLLNLLYLTSASARLVALPEPVSGVRHTLMIFAKFKDEAAPDTPPAWAKDVFDLELPGSLSHFYAEMSFGQFTLNGTCLPKRYPSDHSADYYGDEGYGTFNKEILTKVDAEVDFGAYDNDGPDNVPNSGDDDGYVDMVFINLNSVPKRFYVVELENATGIASLGLSEDFITDDPSAGGEFIRIREKSGTTQRVWSFAHAVGSMAHEFGHTLGLMDLYDTEYEGPEDDSAGIGNWGLMGRGTLGWHGDVDPDGPVPFCALNRLKLGWIGELVEMTEDMQGVRLEDVALGGKVVKIQVAKYEYFLLENRQPSGNHYDRDIPKGGLLIYHIGPGSNRWEEQKFVDIECADGLYRDRGYPGGVEPDPVFGKDNLDFWAHDTLYRAAHNGNLGDATDVFDGVRYTAFGPDTNPASTSNAGTPTGIYVRSIHFEGTTAVVDIHPRPVMLITDEVTFLDQNGDGIIEAGEEVSVRIRLKNVGGIAAKGVQCLLRTNDPYVTFEDSVASFGELTVGGGVMRDIFQFKVAEGFRGRRTAPFELEIRDEDGNVWMETAEAEFVSPQIPLTGLAVLDGGTDSIRGFGNGDGVANPGETIGVRVITEFSNELSLFRVVYGTEDALVRQMGSSFLLASDIPPGHRIPFETQVVGHFVTYRDTLHAEVTGKDETPPQVLHAFARPRALEPGTSTSLQVPKQSVVEGGQVARMEARIYAALTDSEWVDTVVLEEDEEAFHGTWSYQGVRRFVVRIYAEDEEGNGMLNRPLEYLIFYSPNPPVRPSSWISWSAENALTDNHVGALLSDAHGDVWVGTWEGVTRFRGSEWTCWKTLDELQVKGAHAFRLDGAGNVWVLTVEAVSRFSGSSWTTWGKETQEFDGKTPIALFTDASDDIVVQLINGVLLRFQNGGWKQWTTLKALVLSPARCSDLDPFGSLWIGTMPWTGSITDATVARFDGTQWTTWSSKEGLVGEYIWALLSDALGRVWIGLWPEKLSGVRVGGGIGCFDGSEWRFWTERDGLISNWVKTLWMDSTGNLWVGSKEGVSRYDGTAWQSWAMGSIAGLVEDAYGRIWAGGSGGVSMFDGSGWKRWTTEDGLASNAVSHLLADASGRVWVGTDNGLSMYAPMTTGITPTHQEAALPRSLVLSPNYPNPFNSTTAIRFEVPETTQVRLVLYNVLGQRVRTLVDAKHNAGSYTVRWDGKDDAGQEAASGVYIGRLEAGGSVSVRKLVLLR